MADQNFGEGQHIGASTEAVVRNNSIHLTPPIFSICIRDVILPRSVCESRFPGPRSDGDVHEELRSSRRALECLVPNLSVALSFLKTSGTSKNVCFKVFLPRGPRTRRLPQPAQWLYRDGRARFSMTRQTNKIPGMNQGYAA